MVLVHPAWFGGWCWRKLAPLLAPGGHQVLTPTLSGLGERAHLAHREIDLDTHIADVVNVLEFENLTDVALIGHSSAGMVISGVAEAAPERVAQLIYLDAFVPEDGQCLRDLIPPDRRSDMDHLVESEGNGWLLPRFASTEWEQFLPQAWTISNPHDLQWVLPRLRPTPFGHFTTPVTVTSPIARKLPRTYVRFTGWPNPGFDRLAVAAENSDHWRLRRLHADHIAPITSPSELADVLLELLGTG